MNILEKLKSYFSNSKVTINFDTNDNIEIQVKKQISPNRCILNNQLFKIKVDQDLTLSGYTLILQKDLKIKELKIFGKHPNADSDIFCIDPVLQSFAIDEIIIQAIEKSLSTYYLDKAYFKPWNNIHIER